MADETSPDLEAEIENACQKFEEAWQNGDAENLSSFLNQVDELNRSEFLNRLLSIDIEQRLALGETVSPEQYDFYGADVADAVRQLLVQSRGHETYEDESSLHVQPPSINGYKPLQIIGEGGMGVVWMADQLAPVKRRVALKVIKPGMDSKQVIARFEAERQALALMNHQNISKVLDVGMTSDQRPFFAMELVNGLSITAYCDRHKSALHERLRLFVDVCHAVQHAHQKGIIHRDLKPSNVLVDSHDGQPIGKIIDFGLAKALEPQNRLTDKTLLTEYGQVVGTLPYMSPEQAEMSPKNVDSLTDIYSLGVMLYELLTGDTPLGKKTVRRQAIPKIIEIILDTDPPRPSTRISTDNAVAATCAMRKTDPSKLRQILRGELDWVVMKALERDPTRRYQTAIGLAKDVENFIRNEPVGAKPPSLVYRTQKFLRRNRVAVTIAGSIVLTMLIGILLGLVILNRSNSAVYARGLVESLTRVETRDVAGVITELTDYWEQVEQELTDIYQRSEDESKAKLHAALALSMHDNSAVEFLGKRLLVLSPEDFAPVRDILLPHSNELVSRLWQVAMDDQLPIDKRYRAASALAKYDLNNEHWASRELCFELASFLVRTRSSDEFVEWKSAIHDANRYLRRPLLDVSRDTSTESYVRVRATESLTDFLENEPDMLFELLVTSNELQFNVVFDSVAQHKTRTSELAVKEIARPITNDMDHVQRTTMVRRKSIAAMLLYRFGQLKPVIPFLEYSSDPSVQTHLMHAFAALDADPIPLVSQLDHETNSSIRRALVLSLGEYEEQQFSQEHHAALIDKLQKLFEFDPDAGMHAAARWALVNWGYAELVAQIEARLAKNDRQLRSTRQPQANWYINTQGQTFVILDADTVRMGSPESEPYRRDNEVLHTRRINRQFAISATEVTREQWKKYEDSANAKRELYKNFSIILPENFSEAEFCPQPAIHWYDAAHYCNWLSEQEGIPPDQWCYQTNEQGEYDEGMQGRDNYLTLSGYRIPTEAEWEFACRANTTTAHHFGITGLHLDNYAWHYANSKSRLWPVGSLKPNDFGLFDMHGSLIEWCHEGSRGYFRENVGQIYDDVEDSSPAANDGFHIVKGGAAQLDGVIYSRSAMIMTDRPFQGYTYTGFRPVRTIPKDFFEIGAR